MSEISLEEHHYLRTCQRLLNLLEEYSILYDIKNSDSFDNCLECYSKNKMKASVYENLLGFLISTTYRLISTYEQREAQEETEGFVILPNDYVSQSKERLLSSITKFQESANETYQAMKALRELMEEKSLIVKFEEGKVVRDDEENSDESDEESEDSDEESWDESKEDESQRGRRILFSALKKGSGVEDEEAIEEVVEEIKKEVVEEVRQQYGGQDEGIEEVFEEFAEEIVTGVVEEVVKELAEEFVESMEGPSVTQDSDSGETNTSGYIWRWLR